MKKWLQRGIQRPFGTPFAYEVSAGAVVFRVNNGKVQYLLLQYPYGYWDFVKGHCEGEETLHETMIREMREETSLETKRIVAKFHFRSRYTYHAKGREREHRLEAGKGTWIFKTVHFFLAEAQNGEAMISHEHIGVKWFSYQEASDILVFDRSKEILSKANEILKKE
ncbi:MAG: NUDIX domain-containing protein [Candidatus Moraniibacteriota bacterium]